MFLFRLAGHLGMTVAELSVRMSSAELTEWMALDLYHEPLPQPWRQTGVIASAMLAPYADKGKAPQPDDFVPTAKGHQGDARMLAELKKLKQINRNKKR